MKGGNEEEEEEVEEGRKGRGKFEVAAELVVVGGEEEEEEEEDLGVNLDRLFWVEGTRKKKKNRGMKGREELESQVRGRGEKFGCPG